MPGSTTRLNGKRSFTGHHNLLPAVKPDIPFAQVTQQPEYGLIAWTFGRGSVIWKIWPAVLLHTIFAAAIVSLEKKGGLKNLAIPNVMLTVLGVYIFQIAAQRLILLVGVVIGFVISYRAMSGYDRYWMGRTAWSDIIRNARTMGRLIWFHVPSRMTPKTTQEIETGLLDRTTQEMMKVMAEKRVALDLVEGFAVALKHHIRGEIGIYYEDLYSLIRPLHDHEHTIEQKNAAMSSALPPPTKARRIASNPGLPRPRASPTPSTSSSDTSKKGNVKRYGDPTIPPINAYGTFPTINSSRGSLRHSLRRSTSATSQLSNDSLHSQHQPLQPSRNPGEDNVMHHVSGDLIPFAGVFSNLQDWIRGKFMYSKLPIEEPVKNPYGYDASQRKWSGPLHPKIGSAKHNPSSHEHGENLPLEILRCMSEWCSVLEDRNTVPGTSLGSMIGCISAMEDSLVCLERILTTPLPFVYSVHIRHTVWIYLFFLPFQLVAEFSWYTIPGVSIAAFIYLGFLAAGEEIEQPFAYDENDLDLDMFCQEIIHVDIENLKKSPCLNAYFPQTHRLVRHRSMTLTEVTKYRATSDSESD